jgi:hypothetical protein
MEEALRRNRNVNLHKLPVECVLKPVQDHTAIPVDQSLSLCLNTCMEHFTELAGAILVVSCSIITDKCCSQFVSSYSSTPRLLHSIRLLRLFTLHRMCITVMLFFFERVAF